MSRASLERALPAGETLLLDTSVLIAYLNGHDRASPVAGAVIDDLVRSGRNPGLVSMVTVMEVLAGPARGADDQLYDTIVEFLTQLPVLRLREIDFPIAERAASLRARSRLRTPDALIIATGLVAGVGWIVSNDREWPTTLAESDIPATVVLLDDHLPFST